ncbi:MAG: ABC transporter permease [Betaproteobacteria bacterium]|nr:ABC transporter permease [Betaproteobacteria bacterium]
MSGAPAALARVGIVARKELVDSFRDRRSMLVILVTAVAAGPLLLLLVLNLVASQIDRDRELKLPVAGIEHAPALAAFLERQQVTIVPAPADFERKIRDGDLDVVVDVDEDFAADVAAGRSGKLRLNFDRSRDRARNAIEQTQGLLRAFAAEWGQGRLLLRGVAPEVVSPLEIEVRDFATPQSSGALVLGLLAYYALFAALIGAMAAALDTTAGERERGSLEPLLTTPAAPLELAAGKWLALCVLDALVVAVTLGGFYLTLRFAPLPSVGIPFLFGFRQYAAFIAILAPLILLATAVLLYVGLRGRSVKEAQANVSVLMFAASILPVVQMFMRRKDPEWLLSVPVAGQYALLSRVLRGDALVFQEWLQAFGAPTLLALAALLLTARLLAKESVLAGR